MQITFLMKFTEIFLSSAELCYCDRNKEMKPSRVLSEKVMAPYSGTLAWKIPWTEEPGGLRPWGHEESDTYGATSLSLSLSCIGEGNGNPLQCSCLENPRDGGAWRATVCGVAESDTTEAT